MVALLEERDLAMSTKTILLAIEFSPALTEASTPDVAELLADDVASWLLTCGEGGTAWGYGQAQVDGVSVRGAETV